MDCTSVSSAKSSVVYLECTATDAGAGGGWAGVGETKLPSEPRGTTLLSKPSLKNKKKRDNV